jgi:hypothetical protein
MINRLKQDLISCCNFLLEQIGINTPINQLHRSIMFYVYSLIAIIIITGGSSYFALFSIRGQIADNILANTGLASYLNPLYFLINYILKGFTLYCIYIIIKYYMDQITYPITVFRNYTARLRQRQSILGRCINQILEYPSAFAALIYQFQKVESRSDLMSSLTIMSSLLKLPQSIWEIVLGRLPAVQPVEGDQQMLDEVAMAMAVGLTVTKAEIGDVKVDNFIVNVDRNQRAIDNIFKRMNPLLIRLGLVKDSNYDTILEIAKDINTLVKDDIWLKTSLRTCPNELTRSESSTRISELRTKVEKLKTKLNTLTSKELRSDKVVIECHKILASLETQFIEVMVLENSNLTRVKPVGVCIQGEKQIGKTNLVDILTKKVCKYVKENGGLAFRNADSWNTWTIQSRDEFDTGYTGQEITYDDDAFQQKDNKDHLRWFTFISNSPVGTNQADLKQKGLLYKSKLVFATCNKMPIKSITIEDIEALHARFPHTIVMKRNGKAVPKGSNRVETYDWVDMLYGPMETAISDLSANKPVTGGNKVGSLTKLSLDEIVKRIGDDLILQDKYYNSCIGSTQEEVVEGDQQALTEYYNADTNEDDPMLTFIHDIVSSMDQCGQVNRRRVNPILKNDVVEYYKKNLMSFRAFNLIKTMKGTTMNFDDWLESYIRCMVRGYSNNVYDIEEIAVSKLTGLQLACARRLASAKQLITLVRPSTSEQDYKTILEEIEEYLNFEVNILEYDVATLAMAKIVLNEIPSIIKESSWKNVYPWIMSLRNKITGLMFVEHMDMYPTTLTEFLTTLDVWQVEDIQGFRSYYVQPTLFIKRNKGIYAWSPMIEKGRRFVKVDAQFRAIRDNLKTHISIQAGEAISPTQIRYMQYSGAPQNGYPLSYQSHIDWLDLLRESEYRPHSLDHFERIQYVWRKLKNPQPEITPETIAFLDSLKKENKLGNLCKEVKDKISDEVKIKYQNLSNYYARLTQNGMGTLLSLLSRLGIPVSEYWNNLLIENAPVITTAVVATITTLIFLAVVKMFKYGIEGEQQSKAEKKAKQKKVIPRKFAKLRLVDGLQQANEKIIERVTQEDLGFNNYPDSEILEDLFEHIQENPSLSICAMSLCKGSKQEPNFDIMYAAFSEEYDFSYTTPQQPEWKKVTSYREDGDRIIEFDVRGSGTEDNALEALFKVLKTAKYYPYGEWILESYFKKEDDQLLYSIRLFLLNAKPQGEIVRWTRADVTKIMDVQNILNGGNIIDIDTIVTGVQQSAPQAYDTLKAIVRNHMVKVDCVKSMDVGNLAKVGRKVHALGSGNILLLPAHAVQSNSRWIRFSRVGDSKYTGLAVVEREPDFVRDVAVAKIISRFEGETRLANLGIPQELRIISKQEFVFPDISKYLLTSEQAQVDWDGCSTLHYFASQRTVALGQTEDFVLQSFQVPNLENDEPTKLIQKPYQVLCCKQTLQSSFPLSELGDCGSPVILATGKKSGKLLSFHTYYSPKTQQWFSAIITLDDLGVIKGTQQSFQDTWQQLIVPGPPTDLPNGPEVEYVGNLVRPSLPVTKSSLDHWHKSPFADQFEEQLAPGRLDPYDPYIETELPKNREGRKSLVLGPNSEMAKKLPELDQNLLDWCATQLINEQVAVFKAEQSLTRVSDDLDEVLNYAMNGLPDNKYVRGMEINKASGLPWSLNGTAKKSDFIELDEQTGHRSFKQDKNGKALEARVKTKLIQAKQGQRLISLSSSKLKDQPIKIAQAKSGRTRVFHCIPVDLILFQSSLYGPYKEAYTRAGLKAYHAVGIDCKSVGWMELAAYMTKHPNYFDADYKNYDKYLHRQVYKCVRKIQRSVIQLVCPDNWDAARAVEELDAIDTFVVDYRTIYKTNRANKSGSYTTTIDNCLANDIYGLYAWVRSTGVKSLHEYRTNVSSVSFGDDIIKSVSDEYADKYNYCTYRDILNETGHIITPGSKDGEEKPFTIFENLQFLKRGFKFERGMVLAPLLQRSIEGPFVWTDIREDQITVWVNLVQEQMIEAALWGEQYYYQFCNKLKCGTNRRLNEALVNLLNTDWEITFQKFADRYYGS